jgi:hypothetical protein
VILPQRGEVLTAVTPAHPEGDEALDKLGDLEAALALLDRHAGVNRLRDPEVAEQLDHQRDAGTARDQRGINRGIDLEGQPWRWVGHRPPPRVVCTQWVKISKPDATRPCAAPRPGNAGLADTLKTLAGE